MTQLFTNNAYGALASEASAAATTLILSAGSGMRFPLPSGGNDFLMTLIGLDGNGNESLWEIVKVTARATDTLTVVRAQEGTTAVTWPAGTRVELRVTAGTMTSLTDAVEAAAAAPVQSVAGRTGHVTLTNVDVGLANVENKSSASIRSELTSANVTTALGFTPENAANKGAANGYAPLGSDAKVPALYLPAYVDDVLEYASLAALPGTGVVDVIYVTLDTNKTYRWGGSSYTEISPSPGSTDSVTEGSVNLYFTAARAQAALSGLYLPSGGGSLTGNLEFSGTGRRITGDLTNATVGNRLLVQTSTTNGATYFGLIPNGTAVNSQFHVYGASDPTNSPFGALLINASSVRVQSAALGSGTTLPLSFYIGTTEVARASTAYNFLVGTATDDGTHKLQVAGALGVLGADAAVLSRIRAATGMVRVRPYMDATNGVMIDSVNAAENAYLPITLQGSAIRLLGSTGDGLTVGSAGGLTYSGTLTGGTGVINIGSGQIYKDASGNVGIGTSYPEGRLAITAGASDNSIFLRKSSESQTNPSLIFSPTDNSSIRLTAGTTSGYSSSVDIAGNNTGYIRFFTQTAERMRIDSSGRLLIGTSSSDGASTVQSGGDIGITYQPTGGQTAGLRMGPLGPSTQAMIGYDGGTGNLDISPRDGYSITFRSKEQGQERARIDQNGNFLVGTTAQVQGAGATVSTAGRGSSAWINVQAANAANCDSILYLECPGLFGSFIWSSRANAQLRIGAGSTATGVSLAIGGSSWGSFSDERMKDIIEPITEAAQKVSSLRAVIGKYKTDDEGKRRAFLIAQDVKAVLPEAVYQNSAEDDTLSLVYTDMIPLLTAAIQEQQAMIQTLQARLDAANL